MNYSFLLFLFDRLILEYSSKSWQFNFFTFSLLINKSKEISHRSNISNGKCCEFKFKKTSLYGDLKNFLF